MKWADVGNLVGKAAPLIGGLLVGPAGAVVGGMVADALGVEKSPDAVGSLVAADPTAMAKIIEVQSKERTRLAELAAELYIEDTRIAAQDRDSARKRQVSMHDWTPNVLVGAVLLLWGILQVSLLYHEIPTPNEQLVARALGTLDTLLGIGFTYFLGSTRDSQRKTTAILETNGAMLKK